MTGPRAQGARLRLHPAGPRPAGWTSPASPTARPPSPACRSSTTPAASSRRSRCWPACTRPAATASAWTATCSLYDTAISMLTYPATWHLNAGFTPVPHPPLGAPVAGAVPGVRGRGRLDRRRLRQGEVLGSGWPRWSGTRSGPTRRAVRHLRRARAQHATALLAQLEDDLPAAAPSTEWLADALPRGIPCGPINDVPRGAATRSTPLARDLIVETEHPRVRHRHASGPRRCGSGPSRPTYRRAPLRNEDFDEVAARPARLRRRADRARCVAAGAFGDPAPCRTCRDLPAGRPGTARRRRWPPSGSRARVTSPPSWPSGAAASPSSARRRCGGPPCGTCSTGSAARSASARPGAVGAGASPWPRASAARRRRPSWAPASGSARRRRPWPTGPWCTRLDFDDTHAGGLVHATAVVLPAAFAVGEQSRRHRRRRARRGAVAGYEVVCRVAAASPHGFHARGLHATQVAGTLSAARGRGPAARPRRRRTTVDALGIAGIGVRRAARVPRHRSVDQAAAPRHRLARRASSPRGSPRPAATGPATRARRPARRLRRARRREPADPASVVAGLGERWETTRITHQAVPGLPAHARHARRASARARRAGPVGAGDIDDDRSPTCTPTARRSSASRPADKVDAALVLRREVLAALVRARRWSSTDRSGSRRTSRPRSPAGGRGARRPGAHRRGRPRRAWRPTPPGHVVVRLRRRPRCLRAPSPRSAGGPAAPLSDADARRQVPRQRGGRPGAARTWPPPSARSPTCPRSPRSSTSPRASRRPDAPGVPHDTDRRSGPSSPPSFPWYDYHGYTFSLGLELGRATRLNSGHSGSAFDPAKGKPDVGAAWASRRATAYAKQARDPRGRRAVPRRRHPRRRERHDRRARPTTPRRRRCASELFGAHRPTVATVVVDRLVRGKALIEVEVHATPGGGRGARRSAPTARGGARPCARATTARSTCRRCCRSTPTARSSPPGDIVGQYFYCLERAGELLRAGRARRWRTSWPPSTTPRPRPASATPRPAAPRRDLLGPVYPGAAGILMSRLHAPGVAASPST